MYLSVDKVGKGFWNQIASSYSFSTDCPLLGSHSRWFMSFLKRMTKLWILDPTLVYVVRFLFRLKINWGPLCWPALHPLLQPYLASPWSRQNLSSGFRWNTAPLSSVTQASELVLWHRWTHVFKFLVKKKLYRPLIPKEGKEYGWGNLLGRKKRKIV